MPILGFAYDYLYIPETKGPSLKEIDEMYGTGVKPWPLWQSSHLIEHMHEKLKMGPEEVRESNEKAEA
ncbi:hypothetical protein C8R43DRAFT_160577 [Mycena crocata]|nr:hypothetical protein C8R43DRAFT_160577 [Mycena crocata]